jgi:hypothetical protein
MARKQVALRLDAVEHSALKLRSTIENRPVNDILEDAIREYSMRHPISREDTLKMVRSIAQEDAALLKALAEG